MTSLRKFDTLKMLMLFVEGLEGGMTPAKGDMTNEQHFLLQH